MQKINSDIYDITGTVADLQSRYIDEENQDTLSVGLYGYFADINAFQMQNSIIVGSELGNELFPARAKFEKNVISHAILQNITDINATPSKIKVILGIPIETLESHLDINNTFIIDKDSIFNIGGYEFHLQYDLRIVRSIISNNEYMYSARYDMDRKNNISDITNPYLPVPYFQLNNTVNYIYFSCELMQVTHTTIYKKIITNNTIDNKTFNFTFQDQLADFEVCVKDQGNIRYLTPMFEGIGVENNLTNYCFYSYLDTNTIRVRFDSLSYMPSINSEIEVYVKTTKGAEGKFEYSQNFFTTISSDRLNYKSLSLYVIVASNSEGGEDRKSIKELRNIIPKEALSRGSITKLRDVENYLNMLNTEKNIMWSQKKVDNQFERSYYSYLLLKDKYDNVIPTNTIDLIINRNEFDAVGNRKYVLKQGSYILFDGEYGHIISRDDPNLEKYLSDENTFIYTVPFMMVLTGEPLYISYYMSILNYTGFLNFTYLNQLSALQFICTTVNWRRGYNYNPNTYILSMIFTQNISNNFNLLEYDEKGNIIDNNIKIVAVIYNEDNDAPYRYAYGELANVSEDTSYLYQFKFETDDVLNDDNQLRIENLGIPGTTGFSYGYLTNHIRVNIYALIKLKGAEYGRYDLDSIIPSEELEGFTVCNMYTINGGLDLFTNYSEIIDSKVSVNNTTTAEGITYQGFTIKSIPVVRHQYANDEDNIVDFVSELDHKKAYIDNALQVLENNFKIDFKLFNTYGPSRIYTLDKEGTKLINKVNLTLNFRLRLTEINDNYTKDYIIKDLKDIIEDLNSMDHLHIPNIITEITNKYRQNIEYFEFLGIDNYGPGEQHLYRNTYDDVTIVPEFLTINVREDLTPDINITVV